MDERAYERSHPWIRFRPGLARATPQLWSLLGQAAARCEQVARAVLPPAAATEMHKLYLIKGARATTAIEGNTLSEEQVRDRLEGQLELPISQEYLGREVDNILRACEDIFGQVIVGESLRLTPDWIREANRLVLAGLEEHLEEGAVPGEVPTFCVDSSLRRWERPYGTAHGVPHPGARRRSVSRHTSPQQPLQSHARGLLPAVGPFESRQRRPRGCTRVHRLFASRFSGRA